MASVNLNGVIIDEASPAYLIAECGHNHMGDVDIALEMVDAAAANGADCVKFQRIDANKLFTQKAYMEPYNSENAFAPYYGQHRDALTLKDDDFRRLIERCDEVGIDFACTPFEEWSADFMQEIGCPIFKMASFHMNDSALIFHVASFNKPMIISTGNSTIDDIARLKDSLHGFPPKDQYALLHCTSEYPVVDPSHINLGALSDMADRFGDTVWGYSHHYHSPYPAAVSYFFGARIVEAHFTLNRAWKGTDQSFSLEPDSFRWLSNQLRVSHEVAGCRKSPYREEGAPIRKMSRSPYPVRAIKSGEMITADMLELKAPGDGVKPNEISKIIGRVAAKDLKPEEPINEGDWE